MEKKIDLTAKNFLFHGSYFNGIRCETKKNQLTLYNAIMEYAFFDKLPTFLPKRCQAILSVIFPTIKIEKIEKKNKAKKLGKQQDMMF